MAISARNELPGNVTSTGRSVEDIGLAVGDEVTVVIESTRSDAVGVDAPDPPAT